MTKAKKQTQKVAEAAANSVKVEGAQGEATPEEVQKPGIPKESFEADGVEYKFVIAQFNVPGFGVMTAEEALENKEVLAYLVQEKAGVIQAVK